MVSLKQNPFSVYDFLGYVIPGVSFLLAVVQYLPTTVVGCPNSAKETLLFLLAGYMCGHLLSFLSSLFVERYSVWRYGYPSRYLLRLTTERFWHSDRIRCRCFARNGLRILVTIGLGPIAILDFIVDKLFGRAHVKPLDRRLAREIKNSVERLLPGVDFESQSDFHRPVYHFTVENAPAHLLKMQNYVALYGFVRSVSFATLLMTWAALCSACRGELTFWWAGAGAVASFVFFLAFIKFYRRFSLEALMALYAVELKRRWDTRSSEVPPG